MEIERGELRCSHCGRQYPVIRSIPRFVPSDSYVRSFSLEWNMFGRTQLDSESHSDSRDTFVEKTGTRLQDLSGKMILEAGCGMGRFLDVVSKQPGTKVVGFDLSLSVESAYRNVGNRPNVHIVQADVMKPPFAPSSFDMVYSIGVLHHTSKPREAFHSLVPLLKERGEIAIWVYPKYHWSTFSDLYRHVTARMPSNMTLGICKAMLVAHSFDGKAPRRLRGRLQTILPISKEKHYEKRLLDTFDWYSPRYQFKFAPDEVLKWFREAGLINIQMLPFQVSLKGIRK